MSSQILVKIRMMRARNVVCGPRKGDEIPTLCYLWVMPLRCFKCVHVKQKNQNTLYWTKSNKGVSYSICNTSRTFGL